MGSSGYQHRYFFFFFFFFFFYNVRIIYNLQPTTYDLHRLQDLAQDLQGALTSSLAGGLFATGSSSGVVNLYDLKQARALRPTAPAGPPRRRARRTGRPRPCSPAPM